MADAAQWIPARRERNSEVSAWLLPPGTQTRAVRFSYNSPAADKDHRGQLSGVYLMTERYENVARNAQVSVSSNPGIAGTITDGSLSFQSEWTSAPERKEPLSAQSPEWVSLIWPQKIPLRGLAALFPMYGKTEIQVYDGPDDLHPREAADAQWKTVVAVASDHGRPVTFNPNWYEFDHTILTRAVRVRMLSPATENAHTAGATRDGTRAGLNELLAFSPAGQSAAADANAVTSQPPIPVSFTLPEAAYVTLAIEDAKGKHVKNLIGDTFFEAGKHTVYWDGLDESGRRR